MLIATAHLYRSLVRTSFSSVHTKSKSQQNIELMTFALTGCANIFVGCSVTATFFRQTTFFSDSFHYTKKTKKICTWEVLIISHILFRKGRIGTWIEVDLRDLEVAFF